MCSIYGAIGQPDPGKLEAIRDRARDRGRDGGQLVRYALPNGGSAFLGNWRATPTTERERGRLQPYEGIVHNGTIANDQELGRQAGEIDSEVLPRVLVDRSSLAALRDQLVRVVGSYALGIFTGRSIVLAANYKPIHYYAGERAVYFSSLAHHLAPVVARGHAPLPVAPYSLIDLVTFETLPIARETSRRALVIASAGLDSTTVAALLIEQGYTVTLLHFRYGCTAESKEAALIPLLAARLGCAYDFLPIDYTKFKGRSPILQAGIVAPAIAGAEFAHEWVPARNLVMLALAAAYAEANGYHTIALGNNLEEAGAYPDNEQQFTLQFDGLLDYAVRAGYALRVVAPVAHLMKHEIVREGLRLHVPYEITWSCYHAGDQHCGQCGPCFMRREAFARNGVVDPVFAGEVV